MSPTTIPSSDFLTFFGWWEFGVCMFAFLALMAIWWHIGRLKGDLGQVWLAVSILCWSISGLVEVYFAEHMASSSSIAISTHYLDGWRSILSLFNSLFILLALPWFRYLPAVLEDLIRSKNWYFIAGLPFLFSLAPTINRMLSGPSLALIEELDVYYAILTLAFLGYVLWFSYVKRRLVLLGWLSVVCIGITLLAQIYKMTGTLSHQLLLSAIFKTCLIMLFFALALSWVKELAEIIQIDSRKIKLSLFRKKKQNGSFDYVTHITGLPGQVQREFSVSHGVFSLLEKFIQKRIEDEGWLEIKPKSESRPKRTYDVNDHNEVKRMLSALLDGAYGKKTWTRVHHEVPLKEALLENSPNRDRRIRLSLEKENISIQSN